MAAMPADAQPGPAAAPARGQAAAPTLRAEFIALTSNDELLEQLGQALDGDSAIRHCETLDGVEAQLSPCRAHVVMLDAREHVELVAVVERIQLLADSCIVVVFAPAEQTAEIAAAIRRSAAFAVLPIPVETVKTAAVLAGARDEALSRLAIVAPQANAGSASQSRPAFAAPVILAPALAPQFASEPVSSPAQETLPQKTRQIPPPAVGSARRRPPGAWMLGGIVLAVLALAAAWLVMRDRTDGFQGGTPRASAPSTPHVVAPIATGPAASAVTQDGSLDELLIKAQAAFRNRRYTPPEGDNALAYYQSVLAQQPGNDEALEGLQRIRSVLVARLQTALAERSPDEAAGALAQLELIDGGNSDLNPMTAKVVELRVTAALASGDLDQASRLLRDATVAGKLPPDLASNLGADLERRQVDARAQERMAEAARRYSQLRASDPGGVPAASAPPKPGAPTAATSNASAAGPSTGEAGTGPATDSRNAGVGAAGIAFSSRSRPPPAAPPPEAVRSAEFTRTRYVEPVYPKDALARGVRGDVRVRITVDTEGRVKDAEVISSSPPGVFEKSALAAVRRWRFKPIEIDGKAVEASAATTVIFKPAE